MDQRPHPHQQILGRGPAHRVRDRYRRDLIRAEPPLALLKHTTLTAHRHQLTRPGAHKLKAKGGELVTQRSFLPIGHAATASRRALDREEGGPTTQRRLTGIDPGRTRNPSKAQLTSPLAPEHSQPANPQPHQEPPRSPTEPQPTESESPGTAVPCSSPSEPRTSKAHRQPPTETLPSSTAGNPSKSEPKNHPQPRTHHTAAIRQPFTQNERQSIHGNQRNTTAPALTQAQRKTAAQRSGSGTSPPQEGPALPRLIGGEGGLRPGCRYGPSRLAEIMGILSRHP